MTPDEYAKFGQAMGARLTEHFDGFCVVGFHATTGQPVIYTNDAGSIRTRCALASLLQTALVATTVQAGTPNG
jgi:hypothetical protein